MNEYGFIVLVGASLSEPHIDEMNVRNLYIMYYDYIWYVRHPRAAIYNCTATRDIFRRPHEETSAFSGTTCIIIAESAKQIHVHSTVCLSVRTCLEKGQVVADCDRDLGHAPALPGMPSY